MTAPAERESAEAAEIRWYYAQGKRAQNPSGDRVQMNPEDFVPAVHARRHDFARARRVYLGIARMAPFERGILSTVYTPRRIAAQVVNYFGDDLAKLVVASVRANAQFAKRPLAQWGLGLEEWLARVVATGKITTVVRTAEGLSRVSELREALKKEAAEALAWALESYRRVRVRPPRSERPLVDDSSVKRKSPRRRDVTKDFA